VGPRVEPAEYARQKDGRSQRLAEKHAAGAKKLQAHQQRNREQEQTAAAAQAFGRHRTGSGHRRATKQRAEKPAPAPVPATAASASERAYAAYSRDARARPVALQHRAAPPSLRLPSKRELDSLFQQLAARREEGPLPFDAVAGAARQIWPEFDHRPALHQAFRSVDSRAEGHVNAQGFRLVLDRANKNRSRWASFGAEFVSDGAPLLGLKRTSLKKADAMFRLDAPDPKPGETLFGQFLDWAQLCHQALGGGGA